MKIFKEVLELLNDSEFRRMSDYTEDEGIFYRVAFFTLTVIIAVAIIIAHIVLFLTFPIWIVPWLVYESIKAGGRE